jgi:hypothetical protein
MQQHTIRRQFPGPIFPSSCKADITSILEFPLLTLQEIALPFHPKRVHSMSLSPSQPRLSTPLNTIVFPPPPRPLEATVGMDKHLGVPFDPLVEFFVRNFRVFEADFVADDEARPGSASDDQVTQVAVVGFDVALSCC